MRTERGRRTPGAAMIRGAVVAAAMVIAVACGSTLPTGAPATRPPATGPIAPATPGAAPVTPGASPAEAPGVATPAPTTSPPSRSSDRPLVWFAPLPPLGDRTDLQFADGSADYFDLFAVDAPWAAAARSVGVFKIYSSWVGNYATDEQLRQVVEGTTARGQALAVEIGGLTIRDGCGAGIEGFDASLGILDRIHAAGGSVSLVAFDEPYAFGHAYSGPNACRWPVERVAAEAAAFTRDLRAAEPGILVGDIEPLWPDISAAQLGAWLDAYRAAAGAAFDFVHLDADWNLGDWPSRAAAATGEVRSRGIPAGMIYNGGDESTDAAWTRAAREHVDAYEAALDGHPDQVVFQSWMAHPDHALPDSDPATFTGLIRQYAGSRATIAIDRVNVRGRGRLDTTGTVTAGDQPHPIAGAVVRLTAVPIDGAYQLSRLQGRVPAGATAAVVGLRVNTEDAGPGPVHLRFYRIGYVEGSGARNRVPDPGFAQGPDHWGVTGAGRARFVSSDRSGGRMLRVDADPAQAVLVNSGAFRVKAGARYTFTAALRVPASAKGNAYLAVIFLHATEIARHRLELAPAAVDLGRVDAGSGTFASRGARLDPGRYRLRVEYPGDADHWPAAVETTITVR